MLKTQWFISRFALGIFLFCLPLFPGESIRFEKLSHEEGLSQGTIVSILQDSRGFLWLGTEDGLNRYDGNTFKVFKNNPDSADSLSHNWILSLYEDRSGVLWIGTFGGGLNRYDRTRQVFSFFLHQPGSPGSLSDNAVWCIHEDRQKRLWVGTDNGLNLLDRQKGSFIHFKPGGRAGNVPGHNRIKSIHEDRNGRLWLGTLGGGLYLFDPQEQVFTRFSTGAGSSERRLDDTISSICETRDGLLWLGTDDGFIRFNPIKKKYVPWKSNTFIPEELSSNPVFSICEDGKGTVWLGSYGEGVYKYERSNRTFVRYTSSHGAPGSISNNYIQSIYQDRGKVLWIGTDNGLNRFDPRSRRFGGRHIEPVAGASAANSEIWSIYKTPDGPLWVGTNGVLYRVNRRTNQWRPVNISPARSKKETNCRIQTICEDRGGILWLGTDVSGVHCYDRGTRTVRRYPHNPGVPGSLGSNTVNKIFEARDGGIWIGTHNGLDKWEPGKKSFIHYRRQPGNKNSLAANLIHTIYEDSSGGLWIGTGKGLNRLDRKTMSFKGWQKEAGNAKSLTGNHVSVIHEYPPGTLWVGTWGGGLNKLDRAKQGFTHYLEKDGLANDYIYGILHDKKGNLWLSTNNGISKFDPAAETSRNYDVNDGLQSNEFNAGVYFQSNDGEMFFGGARGFNAFYPRAITDNNHIPPVVVTAFYIRNEPVSIGGKSPLKHNITETRALVLSYKDRVFSFDFASLDFSNPGKNRYAFKMEGFDGAWNTRRAHRRFATYTNLDPGEYTFRVKGSNNDGVWNHKGVAIHITIIPPYWRTWWFILAALAAFAVLSYLGISFIRNYITLKGFWIKEKYIGKFKLLERIGSGGMGTIFTARNTVEKSDTVAIKVLKEEHFADANYRRRFKQEAAIIDQLDHPNIVKVMERGQYKQKMYIVMELLKGKTLARKIVDEHHVRVVEAVDIMLQTTEALMKIHSRDIVHRDLKPDNIMLISADGNSNFVKLLDFGLAITRSQTRITQTGTVLGTINYMSPEQIAQGAFSPASDMYSLGVIFYETITGEVPFPGDRITDIMRQILEKEPIPPILFRPNLPEECNHLIMQMLVKTAAERPTTEEVWGALKKLSIALE